MKRKLKEWAKASKWNVAKSSLHMILGTFYLQEILYSLSQTTQTLWNYFFTTNIR